MSPASSTELAVHAAAPCQTSPLTVVAGEGGSVGGGGGKSQDRRRHASTRLLAALTRLTNRSLPIDVAEGLRRQPPQQLTASS